MTILVCYVEQYSGQYAEADTTAGFRPKVSYFDSKQEATAFIADRMNNSDVSVNDFLVFEGNEIKPAKVKTRVSIE